MSLIYMNILPSLLSCYDIFIFFMGNYQLYYNIAKFDVYDSLIVENHSHLKGYPLFSHFINVNILFLNKKKE